MQTELPAGDVVTFMYNGDLQRVSRDDDIGVTRFGGRRRPRWWGVKLWNEPRAVHLFLPCV